MQVCELAAGDPARLDGQEDRLELRIGDGEIRRSRFIGVLDVAVGEIGCPGRVRAPADEGSQGPYGTLQNVTYSDNLCQYDDKLIPCC